MGALQLLVVVVLVFGINVVPAFGPPTWAVLVYVRLAYNLPIPLLVVFGALAAAAGRVLLAKLFRHIGSRLSPKRLGGLTALGRALATSKRGLLGSLLFFLISPMPSNALFEAAGLARLPLPPLTGAFLLGRMGSYSVYLLAAASVGATLQSVLAQGWTSPPALAFGVASIAFVVALMFIDWISVIDRIRARMARARGFPPPLSLRSTISASDGPLHGGSPSSLTTVAAKPHSIVRLVSIARDNALTRRRWGSGNERSAASGSSSRGPSPDRQCGSDPKRHQPYPGGQDNRLDLR
jgi:membrane protein YqaA with SNARE-associated domain